MPVRDRRRNGSASIASSSADSRCQQGELTVCDIMGDWGLYQTSLTLFATLYSGLAGLTVVLGPMLTPDMAHLCDISLDLLVRGDSSAASQVLESTAMDTQAEDVHWSNYSAPPHECFAMRDGQAVKCHKYIYDNRNYGETLTNHVSSCSHSPVSRLNLSLCLGLSQRLHSKWSYCPSECGSRPFWPLLCWAELAS